MKKSIKKNTIKRYSRKTNKIKKIKSKKTKNYKNSKNSKKSRKKMSIKSRKNKKNSRITGKQYGGAQPQVEISFFAAIYNDRRPGGLEMKIIGSEELSDDYSYMGGLWDIIKPDNSSPGEIVRFEIPVDTLSSFLWSRRYALPKGYKFSGSEGIVLKAHRGRGNIYSIKFFKNVVIYSRYLGDITKATNQMRQLFDTARLLYNSNTHLFLNTHYLLTKNIRHAGIDFKSYCMVSDFVKPLPGPDPGDMCLNAEESPGIFSIDKLRHYVLQLARGIAIMHKMGIIHKDIKPGNILNRRDGDTLTPVIIDIPMGGDQEEEGSPCFLGYEKYNGTSTELTISTDWWAFGITVLLLLRVRILPIHIDNRQFLPWYGEIGTKLCKLAELDQLGEGKYEYFRFIFSMMSDEDDKEFYSNSLWRGGYWQVKAGTGGIGKEYVEEYKLLQGTETRLPVLQSTHEDDKGVQGGGC